MPELHSRPPLPPSKPKRPAQHLRKPLAMPDTSQYKVGVVLSVETKAVSGKKPLKICSVDIGSDVPITVVTSASNVRDGSRCVLLLAMWNGGSDGALAPADEVDTKWRGTYR